MGNHERMRIKGNEVTLVDPLPSSQAKELVNDLLVAEMNAVENAEGDGTVPRGDSLDFVDRVYYPWTRHQP
jgi:hypothetical protein